MFKKRKQNTEKEEPIIESTQDDVDKTEGIYLNPQAIEKLKSGNDTSKFLVLGLGNASNKVLHAFSRQSPNNVITMVVGSNRSEMYGDAFYDFSLRWPNLKYSYPFIPQACLDDLKESVNSIKSSCGINRICIVVGLGRGSGTNLLPHVIEFVNDIDKDFYILASLPFNFETQKITSKAIATMRSLNDFQSHIIIFRLQQIAEHDRNLRLLDAFLIADEWMGETLSSLIRNDGVPENIDTYKSLSAVFDKYFNRMG